MSGGLLAEFADEAALAAAAARLATAGLGRVETHMPAPPEGPAHSLLPLAMLLGGVAGAVGAFLLQAYSTTISYPLDVGGRPSFGWPAFVPLAYEFGVLCAVAAGFVAFLIANRMPALYDPIDESEAFRRATRDSYFLAVRSADGAAIGRARAILAELRPRLVEELPG